MSNIGQITFKSHFTNLAIKYFRFLFLFCSLYFPYVFVCVNFQFSTNQSTCKPACINKFLLLLLLLFRLGIFSKGKFFSSKIIHLSHYFWLLFSNILPTHIQLYLINDKIYNKIQAMLKQLYKPFSLTIRNNLKFQFGLIKFNLPDLGQKIKQGTIKKLYVKQGDNVQQFQKLADVASDKQFTQITASDSGIITKIHYKQEDVCQVGSLFLQIQVKDSKGQSHQVKESSTSPKASDTTKASSQSSHIKKLSGSQNHQILATPYVRGLIKKKNLDITKIKGTGHNGRILQSDVVGFSQKRENAGKKQEKNSNQLQSQILSPKQYTQRTIKMSNFEKGMQKSMTESNKIPHLYLHQEFDITQTQNMRKTIKGNQTKVTLMGILIKTFSLALKKYPIINSTYEPEKNEFQYTIQASHNISIAIDSPNGLVVPNIRNVQDCNLLKIQQQLERLRVLASSAKLTSKQLTQGTVCLSNIGTIGGVSACPLILPPQVCIVAIGKMQRVPKYINDELVPRTVLTVSYGCDHRVIDGATVARFSNEWKKVLENPYLALAEMS